MSDAITRCIWVSFSVKHRRRRPCRRSKLWLFYGLVGNEGAKFLHSTVKEDSAGCNTHVHEVASSVSNSFIVEVRTVACPS